MVYLLNSFLCTLSIPNSFQSTNSLNFPYSDQTNKNVNIINKFPQYIFHSYDLHRMSACKWEIFVIAPSVYLIHIYTAISSVNNTFRTAINIYYTALNLGICAYVKFLMINDDWNPAIDGKFLLIPNLLYNHKKNPFHISSLRS